MMLNSLNKLASLPVSTKVYCAHEYTLSNINFAQTVEPENIDVQKRLQHDSALRKQNIETVPSTLEMELLTNPFLRCDQDSVKSKAELRCGQACNDSNTVFKAIREWKDTF